MAAAALAHRRLTAELMDDPALGAALHLEALRGLARLNRLSGSACLLWPALRALAMEDRGRPIRVLDIAAGGGDVPVALARRAQREGLRLRVDGCDISPRAVARARSLAREAGCGGTFFRLDALRHPLPRGYDVLTCSLFMHHLTEDRAAGLLGAMAEAAGRLVLVHDLRRGPSGLALAWAASRAVTRSRVVRTDAVLSARAAYTLDEARALAERAGLRGATVEPRWPCRFLLAWRRR